MNNQEEIKSLLELIKEATERLLELTNGESEISPPPPPSRKGEFADICREIQPNESFDVPIDHKRGTIYAAAYRAGIKVAIRQINGSKYRVWRTS
jgi:hypothetical protein